ncbi:disease resistance RPP13-like protein 4 isoform X1 [Cryptomeria japonica]|uniref:disease resistance RPP13-like protein 4 isoform X1 n=1 Tax=Cryptomeria japonica TaxID=3369 RepID=UPI0027D9F978|nr:disease resistance RPP13-like protein 4 isoform X1 [Cryptomeria japonica]
MASSSSSEKLQDALMESSSSSKKLYDAFINHRGPDVKQTIAFALYDSLEENGFWTFLDEEELQLGDSIPSAIQNAIYSSKVQIAIFSPRYAESSWCLNELVDMLKTKALFIPVFCDVKPYDLRYPHKGVYKDAFAEHEEKGRFSNETLNDWKAALRSSSVISGYEFSTSNDNVEMLCTKIALAVQQAVGKTSKGFPRYVEAAKDQICLCADSSASTSRSAQVKKSCLLPRDSHPVGIDSKVEDMLRLLQDQKIPVIAVVGMGGSGKTFLLQHVYNTGKSRFEYSIWLSISRSFSVKNLQHDIASHIGLESKIVGGAITEERAAELIHEHLKGKRSLIVLDDLWTLSTEDDILYKLGLPAHKDCKVVVTTRNKEVAQNSKAHVYEMKILSDEDSWKLFCFYAFPDCEENSAPPDLEEVGREIVKQCGNLPLAIKTTAASLVNTARLSKWESKRDQLKKPAVPFGGHDPVMDILKLSYDSLPQHLKPCFAYLSFFPEDEEIDPEYLVYLWIGEGFIPTGEGQCDTAWDWLDQLVQLCLLQLSEGLEFSKFTSIGYNKRLTKHCKIHDLLHDLAIHISREKKCAFSVEEAATYTSAASGWCRILLAKKDINPNDISESRPAYLRTLSLSQNNEISSIPENFFSAIRGLRVLDLSSTRIYALPASIGKMVLLKVLNLRGTAIVEVPECVRHLKSLLFLAMSNGCRSLPVWIGELKCLQYLECQLVYRMPRGISKLASLRVLRSDMLAALHGRG